MNKQIKRVIRGIGIVLGALITLLVLAVIGAAAFSWVKHNQNVTLPQPSGPYVVGRVFYDWVDDKRNETFATDGSDKRELMVTLWYPAESTHAAAGPYLPVAWREERDRERGALGQLLMQNTTNVRGYSIDEAPLAGGVTKYPVLVMQPGLGPIALDYTTLAEALASEGYIVVASTPTYSAQVVVFPDGRVARGMTAGGVPDDASPEDGKRILDKLIQVWAADNVFVLDQLNVLNAHDPLGKFTGRLDLNAIGMWGHSFGGAAVAESCRLDARCSAVVNLDGYPYGEVAERGLHQPFMMMWSEPEDKNDEGLRRAEHDVQTMLSVSSQGYALTINGARHFNFTDSAVMYTPFLKVRGGLGTIDGARGLAIAADYMCAFFDHTLKGASTALLDGPSRRYPEVQFVKS